MQSASLNRKFITIEGIEGVGKSTAVKIIQDYLVQQQQEIVVTREPGGTVIAEQLRTILLTPMQGEMVSPDSELLLMFASRSQHIQNVIKPALQAGKWVISDRFVDASFAYQGGGRKLDMQKIDVLNEWIVNTLQPGLTFLLDAPVEIGLARAKHRGPQDRIEQEKLDFFVRVREVYLSRAEKFADRFCVIDAAQSLEKVQADIRRKLATLSMENEHAN